MVYIGKKPPCSVCKPDIKMLIPDTPWVTRGLEPLFTTQSKMGNIIYNIRKPFKCFSNRDHVNIPRVRETDSKSLNKVKI